MSASARDFYEVEQLERLGYSFFILPSYLDAMCDADAYTIQAGAAADQKMWSEALEEVLVGMDPERAARLRESADF